MMRAVVVAVALSLTAAAFAGEKVEPRRWNVVLISADTLRGDMLGVNGNEEVKTPNLDALAAEGINFTHAYTNITTTTPSHAVMLSSLYPKDHRAYDNQSKISESVEMLPEVLARHGWHTAGIVNMPWLNPEVTGVTQGIKELRRGDRIRKANKTNLWVLRFLDRRARKKDQPFFLFVHYVDNHTPYHAPGKYDRLYYPADKDPRAGKPGSLQAAWKLFPKDHRDNEYFRKWIGDIADADYVTATYKSSVTYVDYHVGQLIDRLKKNGQWKNTLFLFTSDHGESLGEHGLWYCHGGLFEQTTRIPWVMHIPDGPKGKSVSTIVDLVDLMPTVLAQLRLSGPKGMRGEDLTPAIEGKVVGGGAAVLEHTGRQLVGVVTHKWKYVRHRKTRKDIYPAYPIIRGRIELYDLERDPGETRNLAKEKPEVVREMAALLAKLHEGGRSFEPGRASVDADTEEALRALGYVQ